MSDSTLNYFVASGTNAERLAFTPSPPSPANAPPHPGYFFYEVDTGNTYSWDGANWQPVGGSGSGGVGISAGTQSVNTGTVVFSNANGVTFGMLGSSRVTASVNTAYAGLNSAMTGGSLTVNSSGISIDLPPYLTTAMASNRGSDFVAATAAFHGTNASGTIASNAISISVDAAAGGNVNFSAGTTSSGLDSVVFSNSNGVSFGLNGSTITGTVKTDYQSSGAYLTTAMASNRGSDFVQATAGFHGTNASGTIASDGISVSVAAPAAASVNFSAGTTSNNLTQVSFKDTNGVSFGLNAGTITATVKTDYQTSGNYLTTAMASNRGSDFVQATAAFAGTNASGTINSTGISVSVGNYITTADLSQNSSKYMQAWELTGNTAGTTSSLQGTKIYFEGGNSITVSGSSNTVKFSVGNYITTADLSQNSSKYVQNWKLTGNTAGTTSSAQGTDLWFSGGNGITDGGNSDVDGQQRRHQPDDGRTTQLCRDRHHDRHDHWHRDRRHEQYRWSESGSASLCHGGGRRKRQLLSGHDEQRAELRRVQQLRGDLLRAERLHDYRVCEHGRNSDHWRGGGVCELCRHDYTLGGRGSRPRRYRGARHLHRRKLRRHLRECAGHLLVAGWIEHHRQPDYEQQRVTYGGHQREERRLQQLAGTLSSEHGDADVRAWCGQLVSRAVHGLRVDERGPDQCPRSEHGDREPVLGHRGDGV